MKRLFALQPLLTTAFIAALVDLAVAYGAPIPPGAKAPIITIVTALATVLVHQSVVSPATLADAVTGAATRTATQLTTTTVGAVGSVTAAGEGVVTGVVGEVLNGIGGLAGPAAKGA
jgi:hypothetical protein